MSAKWSFWAWRQRSGSMTKKLVLLQLGNNANDDGVSFYGIDKMASNCEMSVRAFRNALRALEDDGYLEVIHRPNTSSLYMLKEVFEECDEAILLKDNSSRLDRHEMPPHRHEMPVRPARGAAYPNSYPNTTPNSKQDRGFSPPSISDVRNYLNEKYPGEDETIADSFVNYYESIGWKVGKNKMKKWKSALSGWVVREKKRNQANSIDVHSVDWTKGMENEI